MTSPSPTAGHEEPRSAATNTSTLNAVLPDVLHQAVQQSTQTNIVSKKSYTIPVRQFIAARPASCAVLVHGMQSHSAWFAQTGAFLAQNNQSLFSFDRSGSGLSTEKRGQCLLFEDMLEEIDSVIEYACGQSGKEKAHLIGHCFGALPAFIYAARNPAKIQSLVLATPALYTKVKPSLAETIAIIRAQIRGESEAYFPLPYTSDALSDDQALRAFADTDPLALSQVTASFYYQCLRARKLLQQSIRQIAVPTAMMISGSDTITDNLKNTRLFAKLPVVDKAYLTYVESRHLLEFSPCRESYLSDLLQWIQRHKQNSIESAEVAHSNRSSILV